MKKPTVLVLGTSGMLGSVVYKKLQTQYPQTCFGTIRKAPRQHNCFSFSVATAKKDAATILTKVGKIDYVINCIAVLPKKATISDMITVNALFPQQLPSLFPTARIIHVSSDAVFSPLEKTVYEDTLPSTGSAYGATKLLGEINHAAVLTIRTSILGLDKDGTSIISWILNTKEQKIPGYTNQAWTGCTTLQFAKFVLDILQDTHFTSIRKQTAVLHFIPIKPTTKYTIANTMVKLLKKTVTVKKTKGEKITRLLATRYPAIVSLPGYSQSIEVSLQELYDYSIQKT